MIRAGFLDVAWVGPINTALLIVLAIIQTHVRHRLTRTAREVRRDIHDVKKKVGANQRLYDVAQEDIVRHDLEKHGAEPAPPAPE